MAIWPEGWQQPSCARRAGQGPHNQHDVLSPLPSSQVLIAQGQYQYAFQLDEMYFTNATCAKVGAQIVVGEHFLKAEGPLDHSPP